MKAGEGRSAAGSTAIIGTMKLVMRNQLLNRLFGFNFLAVVAEFSVKILPKYKIGELVCFSKVSLLNIFEEYLLRNSTGQAEREIERNKKIFKVRYIVEQYFGISHLHYKASRAQFTTIMKNNMDAWFRQVALNMFRGMKILPKAVE